MVANRRLNLAVTVSPLLIGPSDERWNIRRQWPKKKWKMYFLFRTDCLAKTVVTRRRRRDLGDFRTYQQRRQMRYRCNVFGGRGARVDVSGRNDEGDVDHRPVHLSTVESATDSRTSVWSGVFTTNRLIRINTNNYYYDCFDEIRQ